MKEIKIVGGSNGQYIVFRMPDWVKDLPVVVEVLY